MADAKIRLAVDGSSQVVSELSRVENKISALESVSVKAKQSLSLLGVGLGINEIARLSDEYTKYNSQLKLATTSELEYAKARSAVSRIAQSSQSDLANTGVLYARIANGTRELGVAQQRVGDITEAVTLSLKVSGATQEESASATLQLSQAFAAGALRGEEFNAVNEASPRLMKALADGLGVPVGALKQMATEGKITSEVMANTLPKALEDLRKEAAQVETISGAYTNLKNHVLEMVGAQAQNNGTAALLSTTINTLANNLDLVSAAAAGFTAVKVSEKIIDMVVNTRASIAASSELSAVKARETAATIATAEANVAETSAKVAHLVETRAAIVSAREETTAKLGAANAAIVAAQAQVQAATSAGALSAALAALRQGELSLTAAMQARAIATTELAVLGQQQAAVSVQVTAATAAQAAAQAGLSTATTAAAAGTGLLSRAMGLLGGPIGIITTVLGLGVTAWMAWGNSSKTSEEKASASVEASTEEIVANLDTQIKKLNERNALAEAGLERLAKTESASVQKLASLKADIFDAENNRGKYAYQSEVARIDNVFELRKQYDLLYERIEAAGQAQRKLDASGKASTDLIEVRERLLGVNKQYLEDLTKLQTAYEKGAIGQKEYVDLLGKLATKTYEASKAGKDAAKSVADEGISYDNLMKSLNERISVLNLDIATEKNLTEAQKVAMKVMTDIATVKNTLTVKQKQEIGLTLELMLAKDKLNEQSKIEAKLAADKVAAHDAYVKSVDGEIASLNDQIIAQREYNDRLGLSKDAIFSLDNAKLEDLALSREQAAADLMLAGSSSDVADRYLTEAARLRELIALRKEGADLQADLDIVNAKLSEQQDTWNMLERTAHDTWTSVANGGKDVASRLRETFKNTFFDWLYQMTVKKWFINVTANLSANASGGAGADMSASISAGKSLWEGFSNASSVGQGISNIAGSLLGKVGTLFGSQSISAFASGLSGTAAGTLAGAGPTIAGSATGLGSMTAAAGAGEGFGVLAAGAEAGSAAGAAGLGASVSSVLAAIPGWGWAALAAAAVAAKFGGGKDRVIGDQTVSGTLGSNELTRNVSWTKDGGWFHSDTSGVWNYKLANSTAVANNGQSYQDVANVANDQALLQKLNSTYEAIKTSSTSYATALGLNADSIAKRVDTINFALGKTQEENDKAMVAAFTAIADSVAKDLLPEINNLSRDGETASTTLARLASGLSGVNGVMDVIGGEKFASTLDGASAAQRLIDLAGGIEKFSTSAAFYAENFLSESEKLKPVIDAVSVKMAALGQSSVTTVEQFAKLVSQQDRTTEAGARMWTELMQIAPQFKQVADYTATLNQALDNTVSASERAAQALDERNRLQDEFNQLTMTQSQLLELQRSKVAASNLGLYDQIQAIKAKSEEDKIVASARASYDAMIKQALSANMAAVEAAASKLRDFTNGIYNFLDAQAVSGSTVSPEQAYLEAKRQFESTVKSASTDDAARGMLVSKAQAYSDQISRYFGSSEAGTREVQAMRAALSGIADASSIQVNAQEQQINLYKQQLNQLETIDGSVLSVTGAVKSLQEAMKPTVKAGSGSSTAAYDEHLYGRNPDGTRRMMVGENYVDYLNNTYIPDFQKNLVESWYSSNPFASMPDANGVDYWVSQIAKQGQLGAQDSFNQAVGLLTNTPSISTPLQWSVFQNAQSSQADSTVVLNKISEQLAALVTVQSSANPILIETLDDVSAAVEKTRKAAAMEAAA